MRSLALAAPIRLVSVLALLGQSFRAQGLLFVVPLFYILTNLVVLDGIAGYRPASLSGLVLGLMTLTIPAGLVAVLVFRLLQYVFVIKPESPVRQLLVDVTGLFRNPNAIIMGLPLLVAMVLFNKGMLELKPLIPLVKPFSWDTTFMELDRMLHGGLDPWTILQPMLGFDTVTFVINIAYNFWFLALFGTFMWLGFARQSSVTRTRFFLAYMLVWWIGGGILAVTFSSAGPVYYGGLGLAPDPFAPLMAYLHDVSSRIPIWALDTQQLLWDGYVGKIPAVGISAFPSMHNASALLFAFGTWHKSRAVGIGFAIYTVVVFLGSVHLGWHYAVDGYAGLALAWACWWLSGFVARWHHRQPATQRLDEGLASL